MSGQEKRPYSTAEKAVERVRLLHARREWWESTKDGVLDRDKPLPPFCDACSSEEFVTEVEDGWADQADGGMVPWPCQTIRVIDEAMSGKGSR